MKKSKILLKAFVDVSRVQGKKFSLQIDHLAYQI